MHEAMHAKGYNHPPSEGATTGVYTTPPFDRFNPDSPHNGCLKP